MANANDGLVDSFIVRAVNLEKFKAGERQKSLSLLKDLEDDIVADLARFTGSAWTKARLQSLLAQVRTTIATAYTKLQKHLTSDLTELAGSETNFAANALNTAVGVDIISVEFSAAQLKAVVGDSVIEGGPQAEWWSRQAASTEQMFMDTVRKGILGGNPTDTIISQLRNKVFQGTLTRNVEALVRTSVASVADEARSSVFEQNADIIGWVQQHSTLDSRTTVICMAYSGKRWKLPNYEPIGHDMPYNTGCPRHWGCRSVMVPGLPMFDQLGDPFAKKNPQRAQDLFESRLKEQGMNEGEIARAVPAAQASMDGSVPDDLNYEQWLKTKPEDFQKEVLGPAKWKLWDEGKITFSDLVSQEGDPLSVEQLQKLAS